MIDGDSDGDDGHRCGVLLFASCPALVLFALLLPQHSPVLEDARIGSAALSDVMTNDIAMGKKLESARAKRCCLRGRRRVREKGLLAFFSFFLGRDSFLFLFSFSQFLVSHGLPLFGPRTKIQTHDNQNAHVCGPTIGGWEVMFFDGAFFLLVKLFFFFPPLRRGPRG